MAAHVAVFAALSASLIHVVGFRLALADAWVWLLGAIPWLLLTAWLFKRQDAPLCHRSFARDDQQFLFCAAFE